MERSLEISVQRIITAINKVLADDGIKTIYTVETCDRERKYITGKKEYYGLLLFYVCEYSLNSNKDINIENKTLLWRQEYIFYNATDKSRDFLWREKLYEAFMYESIGIFAAITKANYEIDKKEDNGKAGVYDFKTDCYITKTSQPVEDN